MTTWFPRAVALAFLQSMSLHAARPMVSYQAVALGATPVQLGAVVASYALLSSVFAVPAGHWVDRFGEPRFIFSGTVLFAVVAAWIGSIDSILMLAVSQAAMGLGQIFANVGIQTLVANGSGPQNRDGRFSLLSVAVSLGQVVGPALGGLLASGMAAGPQVVFLVTAAAMTAASVAGASLWRWPPPSASPKRSRDEPHAGMRTGMGRVLRVRNMPQAMLASLSVLVSIDVLLAYLPAYGQARGIPVRTVGLLLSARAAASMASRIGVVWMLRILGRRRLLAAAIALPAAALLVLPFVSSVPVLFALMLCAGLGLGLGQPLTVSWIAAAAPPELRGMALGARIMGNRMAQFAVPAAVGVLAGAAGLSAIFWALGAMLAVSATTVVTQFKEPPEASPSPRAAGG